MAVTSTIYPNGGHNLCTTYPTDPWNYSLWTPDKQGASWSDSARKVHQKNAEFGITDFERFSNLSNWCHLPQVEHTHLVWSKIFYSERKACNITFPGKQKQETKTISNGKKLVKTTKTWWQSRKRQIRGSLALHPFGRIRRSETTEEIHGHLCEVDVAELDLDKWR